VLVLALAGCGRAAPPHHAAPSTAPAALTPAQRAEVARRRRTEAPHVATAAAGASRGAVLAALRHSVLADARRRALAGQLHGRFREVTCHLDDQDTALARRDPAAPVLRYGCLAISYRSPTPPVMVIGRPFITRVDFAHRRYAWCLFTPVGGEGTHAAATFAVQPSPACAAAP
jgi:hypothetical protein